MTKRSGLGQHSAIGGLSAPSPASASDTVAFAAAHALSASVEPPAEEHGAPKHNQCFHSTYLSLQRVTDECCS